MKATAKAPSNIAFIKYWGKSDEELRLPLNSSISMNMSGAYTITTVEFSKTYSHDDVEIVDGTFSSKEIQRIKESLDRIRQKTGNTNKAKVVTKNTFPKGTGAASSASGFAALTAAGFAAADGSISEKELTIFARIGSGSACRSIPDGFVQWDKGDSSDTSFAYSLYPHSYWDLCDALLIVSSEMKKVSTSSGMESISTSPLLQRRLSNVQQRIQRVRKALDTKNFILLGETIEEDCLEMHRVMQTQTPPLMYWTEMTKSIMEKVYEWRKSGIPVYFTIDAGPNVHLIFERKDESRILSCINEMKGIETCIMNYVSEGTTYTQDHLF